jgi:hypothetical protein
MSVRMNVFVLVGIKVVHAKDNIKMSDFVVLSKSKATSSSSSSSTTTNTVRYHLRSQLELIVSFALFR